MRIVARNVLDDCVRRHAGARNAFLDWIAGVRSVEWRNPMDVRMGRWNPSTIPGDRVVFRLRGNRYRIIAEIDYRNRLVFVRFAGTHAEYDKVDAEKV